MNTFEVNFLNNKVGVGETKSFSTNQLVILKIYTFKGL